MIELPEAMTIAGQINAALSGKRIVEGDRGTSAHKFAFYSRTAADYETILPGKTILGAEANGSLILVHLDHGYTLVLGSGGERILYHARKADLPAKRQLSLFFEDGSALSVSVQGWGFVQLLEEEEIAGHAYINSQKPSPLSEAFTSEYFTSLFSELEPGDPRSVKYFLISSPGLLGFGNGCLQDILWHAGIHPRRRAVGLTGAERQALYGSVRSTLAQMAAAGGRDGDLDLFGCPGGYRRILHSKTAGLPCPACGGLVEKASYLGGAVYFCPKCQVL
jgi:formamidopyrimidine-DNA glycosylase